MKNIKLNNIKNYIELNSKRRIQSKKLHNILNYLESELLEKDLIYYFVTILFPDYKTSEEAWLDLNNKVIELNNLIEREDYIRFNFMSIEIHRGLEQEKKKVLKKVFKKNIKLNDLKVDNLRGYPHIHLVFGFNSLFLNENKLNNKEYNYNEFRKLLYGNLIGYDLDIKQINNKNHQLKKKLQYCIKEYNFSDDVDFNLLNFCNGLNKFNMYYNFDLSDIFFDYLNILNERFNININILKGINFDFIFDKGISGYRKVLIIIKYYIKLKNYKVYQSSIYKLEKNSLFTYRFYDGLDFLKDDLLLIFNNYDYLIMRYFDLWHKQIIKRNFLDNTNLDNFRYIEYKDFILDVSTGNHIDKKDFKGICFCYFDLGLDSFFDIGYNKLEKIIGKGGNTKNISDWSHHVYSYMKDFGSYLVETLPVKGDSLYIYGVSNSGKSLITEKFLRILYGDNLIGNVDWKNKQFLLQNVYNKKFVIMNEFKYMEGDRELLLKLLDRSLVVLNRKYKDPINIELDSKFITISNYSLKDQGMEDVAVLNRLKSYEFPVSFENFRYKYESILEELPVFIYFCIQAFHCKYYKDFEIIRSDIYQLDKWRKKYLEKYRDPNFDSLGFFFNSGFDKFLTLDNYKTSIKEGKNVIEVDDKDVEIFSYYPKIEK